MPKPEKTPKRRESSRRVKYQRREPQREVACPAISIDDLHVFCKLFEKLKDGSSFKDAAEQIALTPRSCDLVLATIEKGLSPEHRRPGFIKTDADTDDPDLTTTGLFYQGVARLLRDFDNLVVDCRSNRHRVIIEASEYSVLCFLPALLKKSAYLSANPDAVLDIRRGYWHQFLPDLENDRVHLALGPKAPHKQSIVHADLYSAPRAIVSHEAHIFKCGKEWPFVDLSDLSRETVFVLKSTSLPDDVLAERLPKPAKEGRHVYVESTAFMYHFIEMDLGVGVGYQQQYTPFSDSKALRFTQLAGDVVESLQYCLYSRKDRELPDAAEALKQAILGHWKAVFNQDEGDFLR